MSGFEFRPPRWLRNPHVQTVLGAVLGPPRFQARTVRRIVPLPEGDALVVHDSSPPRWRSPDPIAMLVHGLGGSHRSASIVRMSRILYRRGVRVCRLDMRGAGSGLRLARTTYHAGCSADVRAAVDAIHMWAPDSPLWLAGISLGANVLLKFAGEAADRPNNGVARLAAIAPPVDLFLCLQRLSRPANRFYDQRFVASLLAEANRRGRIFPQCRLPPLPRPVTMRCLDELVTAPRCGFRDAADYYAQSSSAQYVPRITIPTLILSARDDPFIDPEPIAKLDCPSCVQVMLTDHGGHVGYLGADGDGGWFWGERFVADWLTRSK